MTGSLHLPRSSAGSSPAPRPPSPAEPSWPRSRRAASRSAPLERDGSSPEERKKTERGLFGKNSDLGCLNGKRLLHF